MRMYVCMYALVRVCVYVCVYVCVLVCECVCMHHCSMLAFLRGVPPIPSPAACTALGMSPVAPPSVK
jgi:hypothetical protein